MAVVCGLALLALAYICGRLYSRGRIDEIRRDFEKEKNDEEAS